MLKDEDAFRIQVGENEVRKFRQFFERIRRVGKDEVECARIGAEIAEDVASNEQVLLSRNLEVGGNLEDKLLLGASHLYACDVSGFSAQQFETDASGAAEKVKTAKTFEIKAILKNVEQSLFGKVGRGACL